MPFLRGPTRLRIRLAQRILPKQVPKTIQLKGNVDARVASAHVSTARLIRQLREVITT